MFQRGQIVLAKAGKEKDSFLVVLKQEGRMLELVNGKSRPLSKPKKKKEMHVQKTNTVLSEEELLSDKKIRKALTKIGAQDSMEV